MDQITIPCIDEMSPDELNLFLQKGIDDLKNGNLLDFDEVYLALEKRFELNG